MRELAAIHILSSLIRTDIDRAVMVDVAVAVTDELLARLAETTPVSSCMHKYKTHRYLAKPPSGYETSVSVCTLCGVEL